jgi:RNA polymerase sigma factor (sigma-70 family)
VSGSGLEPATEHLLRQLAPQVLGALVRRYGHFDHAEDAVQQALLTAATQWPEQGRPERPKAWLLTVASRRLTDILRSEQARRRREDVAARRLLPNETLERAADEPEHRGDDTLTVLLTCCHPSLSPASQIALTLRAVGGLTTSEIARAFLVSEATMTRRITRAKQQIKDSSEPFALPRGAELAARLAAVQHILYLIFNEGYASTSGPNLQREDLAAEAIRLTRMLHGLVPDTPELTGLLALMLLTDARRPARTAPNGDLIPMEDQDRSRWRHEDIAEGTALVTAALQQGAPGPYQIQAAIAALHDEAAEAAATDWPQIVALYEVLVGMSHNPMVRLNHAVATAKASGPEAGLALLADLADDPRLRADHRIHAVRAHLLLELGDSTAARRAFDEAAALTTNLAQRRYLAAKARNLPPPP